MQFGYCAGFDEKDLNFAREAGFDGIEMFVPNKAMMDPAKIDRDVIARTREAFDRAGVRALTVFHYADYADRDPAKAKAAALGMRKSMDVAEGLTAKGFNIDRRKILLDPPIKLVGEYDVHIKLHREVTATIKVKVESETEAPAAG